jgi:hypothetical protein
MRTQPAEKARTPETAAGKSPVSRTVTPVGRFMAEVGGMCAVMCVGGSILSFASFQLASWLGYPNLVQQAPELSAAIVAVCLAVPMAVYMAIRGHGRRHNVVMSASTLGVGMVVIGLLASGAIATTGLQNWHNLFGLICGPACLVMIVEMLISFNTYSGRAHHHSPAA